MKKAKIFVSSTYDDMMLERGNVFSAIQKNNDIPGGMELFTGNNIEKFEVIKNDIAESDFFILILGGRYGTICKETNKSFIHMEYDFAKSLGIPIAVFVIADGFLRKKKSEAFANGNCYYDEGTEKYNWFLKIVSEKMVSYYDDINDLSVKCLTTINNMKQQYAYDGWIKCSKDSLHSYISSLNIDNKIDITEETVVVNVYTTEKDHYKISDSLLYDNVGGKKQLKHFKNIFLMQRSSSLVLGAEEGWGAENIFIRSLLEAIDVCENFYHIITLKGIEQHFKRKSSTFPSFKKFTRNLVDIEGYAAVKKANSCNGGALIKTLPEDESSPLFKLDRQARVFVLEEPNEYVQAVFVWNIGDEQSCMHIKGPKMKDYLDKLICYFNELENVKWTDIVELCNKYEMIKNKE